MSESDLFARHFSRKIAKAFKEGQRPPLGSPLSASAVASHFQSQPDKILKLEFRGPSHKPSLILDDGQTKTLVYCSVWINESIHKNLESLAPTLLIRWLRDSVLGIRLRDIEAHDGTHKAVDLLPKVIEMACPGEQEHAYAIMRAVANDLWPEDAIQWLLDLPQMNLEVIEAAHGSIEKDGLETRQPLSKVTAHLL